MYVAQFTGNKFKRKEGNEVIVYSKGARITFQSLNDIPIGFRDMFKTLSQEELPVGYEGEDDKTAGLKIIKTSANGWYDVINSKTGKPINDKSLRIDEARSLASVYGCYDGDPDEKDDKAAIDTGKKIVFGEETDSLDKIIYHDKSI